jgi:hypothetical protein
MGEQSTKLHEEHTIKKGVPSYCGQVQNHRAQVKCARLRFSLDMSYSTVSTFQLIQQRALNVSSSEMQLLTLTLVQF